MGGKRQRFDIHPGARLTCERATVPPCPTFAPRAGVDLGPVDFWLPSTPSPALNAVATEPTSGPANPSAAFCAEPDVEPISVELIPAPISARS